MAEHARYSFLGWLRRGAVALADGRVDSAGRLQVPLELDVIAEGTGRKETVRPSATCYGPGDVDGVVPSAIVRVVPARGVRDFEANFFCAIEFYDEDFPWRYTPRAPSDHVLAPWLWLVALADDEFVVRGRTQRLAVIEVSPSALRSAFPDPATTAAWAHVQIDAALEGSDVAAARVAARTLLDVNPNAGCSRLVCPRRLAPGTRYTAFLIPAFERGRLAGLGAGATEIEAVSHDRPSWPVAADVHGALQFPVYHQWEFTTATSGDFEDLARALQAVPSNQVADDVLVDIQEPGWNVRHRSTRTTQPGAIALPTAVRVPGPRSTLAFGGDPADAALATELRTLLSAGDSGDDDPYVLPPLYGSSYRAGALGAPDATWFEQVNLDPAYRAIAGRGAAAVRDRQEAYIDRIWDRLRRSLESRAETKRWQLSLHASTQLFAKRLAPVLAVDTTPTTDTAEIARRESRVARALTIAAPVHTRIDVGGRPMSARLRDMAHASAFRGSFAKVTRAGGPLMRRFEGVTRAPRGRRLFELGIHILPPRSALQDALAAARDVIDQPARRMAPPALPPNVMGKQMLNGLLARAGLGGIAPMQAAIDALRVRFAPVVVAPVTAVSAFDLVAAVHEQLLPKSTIPARMRDLLGLAQPASAEDAERIDLPAFDIELPDPMYRALAAHPELVVPGLAKLPENSVTMLAPEPAFIDAFMLGANHEITRELLWREVPVPLDATIFRQFWDVRDNPNAIADPQRFRDILPIAGWGDTALGADSHGPSGMRGALTVVVIRGDLLRKYPHSEVFMHPAAWVNVPDIPHPVRRHAKDAESRPPLFSARIAPDVTLLGFQLDANDAIGEPTPAAAKPGWYFVLKERAGDVHFGLDLAASTSDPSWAALPDVAVGSCIDARAQSFRSLPRYRASSDGIAAMLYQRPFSMYVHASRLLHRR